LPSASAAGAFFETRADGKTVRPTALKLLAPALARFTRAAQVLASLNHPNIAAGPLPLEETLQIADALEAAHEKGNISRFLTVVPQLD
jgi:hypothetical protein